ncbi:MAG TPA: helix-turn-helix domain-containing protein [Solirubrobacteraceae bacterium]|nr:helix-turn-helix domain-containing protein [Solirubrobacteraceae bacterium]
MSELLADQLAVGRIELAQGGSEEVLTLEEASALLRLPLETLRASAVAGELPGRVFGQEWRFSRSALLAWLAGEGTPQPETKPAAKRKDG